MKQITILFFCFAIFSTSVFSQMEFYGRYTKEGAPAYNTNLFCSDSISPGKKLTAFSLLDNGVSDFAEILVGIEVQLEPGLALGISAGLENRSTLYRLGASLSAVEGRNSILAIIEKGDGADNFFYKVTVKHEFSTYFSAGLRFWRYHGWGPVLTGSVGKWSLWVMPAIEPIYVEGSDVKIKRLMLGISYKFQ